MEEGLVIVQTVTPNVVYTANETVTVDIEVTNTTNNVLNNVTVTSSYANLGTLQGQVLVNGIPSETDIADGIEIATLGPGETATISYELLVTNITQRPVSITTTASDAAATTSAAETDVVYVSPYTRYTSVSASICTEDIGCVEEVFVEREPVRYVNTCDTTVITAGFYIGIKYENCKGKNKTARRHEMATFTVPTNMFNPDTLEVNVNRICTACRDFAQCITVYLSADFPPSAAAPM